MTAEDRRAFVTELLGVAEVFGETLSDARIEAYFLALSEYPVGAVQAACHRAIKSCRFFPKPAELRDLIEGSGTDRAALAWARLIRAIERVGTYQSVDFGDAVLHATIAAMGGWSELWPLERMDSHELGFKRAEFLRLYEALTKREPLEAPKRLIGQSEADNTQRGYLGRDPILMLGDTGRVVAEVLPALPAARPKALPSGEEA